MSSAESTNRLMPGNPRRTVLDEWQRREEPKYEEVSDLLDSCINKLKSESLNNKDMLEEILSERVSEDRYKAASYLIEEIREDEKLQAMFRNLALKLKARKNDKRQHLYRMLHG